MGVELICFQRNDPPGVLEGTGELITLKREVGGSLGSLIGYSAFKYKDLLLNNL